MKELMMAGVVALAGAGQPAAPRPDVKIERLTWVKDVDGEAPIRTLEVRNDFGDIRARLAPDRRLDVLAVVQRLDKGPEGVGFTVERRGSAVALTVTYPPGRVRDTDPNPPKDSYDRLDLTVFVPEGVVLGAHTLRGMVEVRGLRSDVRAATRDGSIFVATTGTVQARSETGELTALLERSQGTRPLILRTVSGPLQVTVAPEALLDLQVQTGGRVTSDVPRDQSRRPGREGARTLLISSETGSVEVRRADR